jgi:hypothetical protein
MLWQLLEPFITWSNNSAGAAWVRESKWTFGILEVFHLLGLILLFGSVLMFGLRCLGLSLQKDSVIRIARDMAPASAAGFAMMSISGYLMFASAATKYVENPSFQVKMSFYFFAIVTHSLIYIKVFRTREERSKGLWALSGLALMLLWLGVGVAGRAIAFI